MNMESVARLNEYKAEVVSGVISIDEEERLAVYWLEGITNDRSEWVVALDTYIIIDGMKDENEALEKLDDLRGYIEKCRRDLGIEKAYQISLDGSYNEDGCFIISESNLEKVLSKVFENDRALWEFGVDGIYTLEEAKIVYDYARDNSYLMKESELKYGGMYRG